MERNYHYKFLFRILFQFFWVIILTSHLFVNLALTSDEKSQRIELDEDKKLNVEKLSHKKEGFYFNGLPLFSADPVRGQGGGFRANLFFNGKKTDEYFEYQPYQFKVSSQLYQSSQGAKNYFISLDSPYIFDTAFRWKSSLGWDYNPNSQYFGIGEKSLETLNERPRNQPGYGQYDSANYNGYSANQSYLRQGFKQTEVNGNYTDSGYNSYTFNSTTLFNSVDYTFWKAFKWIAASEISKNIIRHSDKAWSPGKDPIFGDSLWETSVPNGVSKLTEDYNAGKIKGYNGGQVNYFRTGIAYDTRDFEPDPDSGILIELNVANVSKRTGSSFDYNKLFFQTKYFKQLFPSYFDELVFATRIAASYSSHGTPFSEIRYMWSSDGPFTGLGGLQTVRGYRQDRFIGAMVVFGSYELRWRFASLQLGEQNFTFSLVPFYDYGRVWDSEKGIGLRSYKFSFGNGLRIIWNQATVILIDIAKSKEDTQMFIDFAHAF